MVNAYLRFLILNNNNVIYSYVKVINYGLAYSEVSDEISLKNEYIERVSSISKNKVKTLEINNFRTDSLVTIIPQEGSEEFIFSFLSYPENKALLFENVYWTKQIDRKDWKVTANSEQNIKPGTKEGPVGNIIDGNLETIWHSKYNDKEGGHDERKDKKDPFQVTFDLGKKNWF